MQKAKKKVKKKKREKKKGGNQWPPVAFGSNAALEMEVFWCLDTVKNHLYASNKGVWNQIFPLCYLTCTLERQTAVSKAGPFVLMFDEPLNKN